MQNQNATVQFLFSPTGRGVRIVIGLIVAYWAYASLAGIGGVIAYVVAVVLFLSGVVNFCGLSPLLGGPFMGKRSS